MGATGFKSYELADVAYLVDGSMTKQGSDVVVAGGQTSALTPSWRFPPGTVVVKETGDGLYYKASGADGAAAGDIATAPSVSSLEAADTDWDGTTITAEIWYPDGTSYSCPVLMAGTDDSTSEVVTALNANVAFRNHFIASGLDAAVVVITALAKGNVRMKVSQSVITTGYGAAGTSATGVEPDVRVIADYAETKDLNGSNQNYTVPSLLAGKFREASLYSLTDEAKAILTRRGSRFE